MTRGVPIGPVRFSLQDLDKDAAHHYTSPATSSSSTTLKSGPNTFDLDLE